MSLARARRKLAAPFAVLPLIAGLLVATSGSAPVGAAGDPPADPLNDAIAASAAPGSTWQPEPEQYGHHITYDVPVRMSDGTILRADVDAPTDLDSGADAPGPFPVLLTMTPYGKDAAAAAGLATSAYLVRRGYIDVAVDVRGTGSSGGTFTLFDPKQASDGVELVNWAAHLPHSTGRVGMHGASYLGIDQLLTAGAVGKNSPLKAIFPVISTNDIYRDTAFMGGIPDGSFDAVYLGALLPLVNLLSPLASAFANPLNLLSDLQNIEAHLLDAMSWNERFIAEAYLGGPNSYDNSFWAARRPADLLDDIVANGIPAYLVGGEFDLFQRGEPLNFAGLQNAWAGRPVDAPMLPDQATTGRYQLLDGPFTHLEGGGVGAPFDRLMLEWFDTWLKDEPTGMGETPTPLHYYDLGTNQYSESATYPIAGATPTTFYFGAGPTGSSLSQNDGSLLTAPPAVGGSDSITWAPIGSTICARSQDQWVMGTVSFLPHSAGIPVPCIDDDRLSQLGPTSLTYSTAPVTSARTIAGPISATLYAKANTKDTEWVVNVEDVSPDGTSKPLTQGALLGSFRAVNDAKSWPAGNGTYLIPYHDYTSASVQPVVKGQVTRYDVEVFPTYATIAPGHRIRVTLSTTDFPHLVPTPPQYLKLLGGTYQVQRSTAAPSSVTIPLIG
ncbi:MAG TPA: CocE/NonD family hydrolase [Jatrophihabitantaceae bacterium]|nr:CocE/NonD family hydrolase [Jatrophihabitantaceae bacterium]